MKKKRYYILLTVILVIFASIFTMQTVFAKENTSYKGLWDEDAGAYLITDTNDLKIFRNSLSEYDYAGKKVLLTQNIDIKKDDDIGTVVGTTFNGYFNGQGYTISGYRDASSGLFYTIGVDSVVTKLNLDVDVELTQNPSCGGYAPMAYVLGGKVAYCSVTGKIHASSEMSGFDICGFVNMFGGDINDFDYYMQILMGEIPYPDFMMHDCLVAVDINIDKAASTCHVDGIGLALLYDTEVYQPRIYNILVKNQYFISDGIEGELYKTVDSEKDNFCKKGSIIYTLDGSSISSSITQKSAELSTECTGKELKQKSTYADAGWDFNKIWNIDTEGYHDKIYLDTNQAPEGVETFIDDIGPYYYDSELKFVNNGYPYIRSDVLEPVFGDVERRMVTVSAVYPDITIGYYSPAVVKPEITITGIEGVEADQLKDFIDKYKLEVSCDEYTQYLASGKTIGNLSDLSKAKLTYQTNTEYVFNIDFNKSTVTSGKLSVKPNQYKNIDTLKKAEAFLALGEKGEKESLENITDETNVIKNSYCWTVINIARYDKLKDDSEIQDLLDKWFEAEKRSFKEMYAENKDMTQELTTTWQRELIAITAAGFDPADIKEYTKGTYGEDDPGFDLVQAVVNEVGKEGAHMHVPFWLIGLDSGDYATSSDYQTDVNNRVQKVYKLMNMGVFGAADGIGMDYVGMYTQGLAKYINPKEGTIYYDVAQKVNEMLKADGKDYTIAQKAEKTAQIAAMKEYQCPLGGWITYGNYNPATTAQAVVMLSCMGIDAFSEELTTEAGYNMLDSFIQAGCNLDENGLPVSIKDTYEMTMNKSFYSTQAIYAIISWYRLMNNQTALYDCTNVVGVPQVEKMISNLPTEITLNDEKAIETAKAAYDALTKGQKKYVDNASVLEEASKKLAELKKAEEPTNPTQPTKPVALKAATVKATATSYNQVKLTWKKVDGAESYKIYRSTSKASGYKNVETVKTLTWTDSKLTTGKTYYYKVEATAKNATSSTSKVVSAKPVLTVPSSTKAVSSSYNKVTVTWKKVAGVTGYKVYRATSKNGSYKKVATVKTLKWTDSKLKTGKTYYYKVRAYNKTANSGYSKVVKAKPVPAKTSLSSVKNAKGKKATLTWKKVAGATGYKVYRTTKKNGSYKSLKTVKNVKTWTDSNLKKNKTYYYKVRAYKTVDGSKVYGAYSDVKSVTVK